MMISSPTLVLSLMVILLAQVSQTYKILYLLPLATRSHKNVFDPLITELAKRNHEVTVVSPLNFPKPVTNVKEIILKAEESKLEDSEAMTDFIKYNNIHPIITNFFFKSFSLPACESYLQNPEVKLLLKSGKQFDVVIVSAFLNDCALATAPLMGKYIIMHSPANLIPWNPLFVPQPPSYVPNLFLPYTSKMNFFQRLNNVVTDIVIKLIYNYHLLPGIESELSKHLPEHPSVNEAHQAVSFTLTNADPVLTSARPSMPNIVNVGGMHCKDANPLNKELEDFIGTTGNDGFIYFSLGSSMQFRFFSNEVKTSILNSMSKLKQKVIFKCEEELKNVPSNVKLVKWAPQQDILGHSKIKAFITHGGRLSLQEAVYHAVPVVAVPLFGDQPSNVARVEELGIGVKLSLDQMSGESVFEAVNEVLSNSYKEKIKKYSAVFRDHYQHPIQRAAFWVEYVVRHDGAKHLRSPGEDLNFFQYFLLDIIGLILAILLSVLYVLYSVGRYVLRKISPAKGKKTQKLREKKKQ